MSKSHNNISRILLYSFNQLRLTLRTFSLSIFLENIFLSISSSFLSSFAIGGRGNELITNNNNNHGPNTMSFKNQRPCVVVISLKPVQHVADNKNDELSSFSSILRLVVLILCLKNEYISVIYEACVFGLLYHLKCGNNANVISFDFNDAKFLYVLGCKAII